MKSLNVFLVCFIVNITGFIFTPIVWAFIIPFGVVLISLCSFSGVKNKATDFIFFVTVSALLMYGLYAVLFMISATMEYGSLLTSSDEGALTSMVESLVTKEIGFMLKSGIILK